MAPHATTVANNEVLLVGRLSQPVEARDLPSGDTIWIWRLVVDRPAGERGAKVDTIDCVTYSVALGRRAESWVQDQTLEVSGRLRRRFFRANGAPASRYEVEALRVKRV